MNTCPLFLEAPYFISDFNFANCYTTIKEKNKMKIERILYYLSERVYGLFSTLFF